MERCNRNKYGEPLNLVNQNNIKIILYKFNQHALVKAQKWSSLDLCLYQNKYPDITKMDLGKDHLQIIIEFDNRTRNQHKTLVSKEYKEAIMKKY